MQRQSSLWFESRTCALVIIELVLCGAVTGCERAQEKKIIEIRTPGTNIEVRKGDRGATVEVERDPGTDRR